MPQKHIIIAVIGLTPQIITETLYALAVKRKEPIIPYAIYIITTLQGKKQVIQKLLDDGKGQFYRFCSEYGFDASRIAFDESTISVVRDADNRPLEDIRNTADNEIMANFIINFICEKSVDTDSVIHASAAGGRKTMSIYLAYALTLFGREQDKLYHVLVSPAELESHPDFYYIPKDRNKTFIKNGMEIPVSQASIELAEIPFIRLREKLEQIELERNLSYIEMVWHSQCEIDLLLPVPEIIINDTQGDILINGVTVSLPPLDWAVHRTFLEQKTDFCVRKNLSVCGECTECFLDMQSILQDSYLDRIFKNYARVMKQDNDRTERSRKSSNENTWHREKIARINSELEKQFKNRQVQRYCSILPDRKTQGKKYGMLMDKNKIRPNYRGHSRVSGNL